jgi:hypothetical protein
MKERSNTNLEMQEAISRFIEIGRLRNELVHQNFATFEIEKTALEIYEAYQKAAFFVQALPRVLREYPCNGRRDSDEGMEALGQGLAHRADASA